jgi:hypothetical protein
MRALTLGVVLGLLALTACTAASQRTPAGPAPAVRWQAFLHLPGVVDLAGPGTDGSLTVAAAGRLFQLSPDGVLSPFARGARGYVTATGTEPYIARTADDLVPASHCSFSRDTVYAIEPGAKPGVIVIDPQGQASRFADLPRGAAPDGIVFDTVGRFGHRLLVTAASHGATTLFAIDCKARVTVLAARGPSVEGGIVVAPPTFGRFGGDLIAPNETSGRVYAFQPNGSAATLVQSGLAHGGDIGVESAGFVPPGFGRGGAAYLSDRVSPGNLHPGTNNILQLSGPELLRAGVRPGDLLVATEGGAKTIAVHCSISCTVKYIADGPAISHGEGHILIVTSAVPAS